MTLKQLLMTTTIGLAPILPSAAHGAPIVQSRAVAETDFAVPAGPLDRGLRMAADQSGQQLLFDPSRVTGRTAPEVRGRMTADEAIRRLLEGSGLVAERTGPRVLVIRPAPHVPADLESAELEDVVVTGSLIRGAGDGPSPITQVTRADIDRQGYGGVAQALQALPQNFGGTGNEGALQNGADTSASNGSFASGVNLRGLGSDATLVLVNGRRMAGSGARADFADISTIPTAAVERIDVLLDGASALYGSDAVGGVVNIILRRDFEGGETRLRAGSTTDGPSGEWGFAQSLGHRWGTGGGLVSYEYLDREALPVSARARAGDADLRPFGGTDRRSIYSHPGNIVTFDAARGGYVPLFAIPENQNGTGLRPSDFRADRVNLENQRDGMNVLGRQTRHSVFAAGHQDLGDRLTVSRRPRLEGRRWPSAGHRQPAAGRGSVKAAYRGGSGYGGRMGQDSRHAIGIDCGVRWQQIIQVFVRVRSRHPQWAVSPDHCIERPGWVPDHRQIGAARQKRHPAPPARGHQPVGGDPDVDVGGQGRRDALVSADQHTFAQTSKRQAARGR